MDSTDRPDHGILKKPTRFTQGLSLHTVPLIWICIACLYFSLRAKSNVKKKKNFNVGTKMTIKKAT